MNEHEKMDLLSEVERCTKLFNSGVFINHQIFTQSALVELLIRLNHVLKFLNAQGIRVDWKEDVEQGKDITDLINDLRNGACHQNSPLNSIQDTSNKFTFNVAAGYSPTAFVIGDLSLGCDYSDDIAFFYGNHRIYLIRHIKRLLEHIPAHIQKAPEDPLPSAS